MINQFQQSADENHPSRLTENQAYTAIWRLPSVPRPVNLAKQSHPVKGAVIMTESRIPQLDGTSKKAAFTWLTALHKRELLFCLDDKPQDIFRISDGARLYTDDEAKEVTGILDVLFAKRGDQLHELAFEVVSRTFHTRAERRALKTMYG